MHEPKHVLHIITGLGLGGAETILYRLLHFWTSNPNCTHTVISLRNNLAFDLSGIGIKYKIFDLKDSKYKIPELLALFRYIKHQKPDLIHAWMYHACFISFITCLLKIPVVWAIHHSLHDFNKESLSIRILIRICSRVARLTFVKRIIYVSGVSKKHHEEFGYPKLKSIQIPNGFDCDHFAPNKSLRDSMRRDLNLPNDVFVIGSFGRFHPIKNHKLLIDALSLLNKKGLNFCVLLAGDGMHESNSLLVEWVQSACLNFKVKLLGSYKDIAILYNAIDLYVLSSNSESFPNVLGEAMATGVLCVATDVGDSRLIISGAGWVVPTKDPEQLASAVFDAYKLQYSQKAALSVRARALIQSRFSLSSVSSMHEQLYRSLFP